jgi:hypothetical protein
MNFEPLIERDLDAIPAAIAAFRADHSAEETWTAVTRFAVLAFAPSQHSKHALLTCLSTWDLREALGARFDEGVVQCALYAASSRQPWSEPPILDPPELGSDQRGDLQELREAIAAKDRLRAERWLAKRFRDADFPLHYLTAASDGTEDLGHALILANASLRLAALLGEQGRYAMLRVGLWEMVALGSDGREPRANSVDRDLEAVCSQCFGNVAANDGEIVSAHALFLFDALLQTKDELGTGTVREQEPPSNRPSRASLPPPPVYDLARDYGACLKGHAIARRLVARFPALDANPMLAALQRNLDAAPAGEMAFA